MSLDTALGQLARRVLFVLFENAPGTMSSLQDFWRRCTISTHGRVNPITVEYVTDFDCVLPLEYLPLIDVGALGQSNSREGFIDSCRSLLGFSCIVRRAIRSEPQSQHIWLDRSKDSPMRFAYFQNDALDGAAAELEWLKQQGQVIVLSGPYP